MHLRCVTADLVALLSLSHFQFPRNPRILQSVIKYFSNGLSNMSKTTLETYQKILTVLDYERSEQTLKMAQL